MHGLSSAEEPTECAPQELRNERRTGAVECAPKDLQEQHKAGAAGEPLHP